MFLHATCRRRNAVEFRGPEMSICCPRGTNPSPLKFTISSTSCVYSHSEVKKQPLNLIQEVVSTHIHLEPPRTVKISQNYCTLQITCDPKMALGFALRDADMINGISFLFSQWTSIPGWDEGHGTALALCAHSQQFYFLTFCSSHHHSGLPSRMSQAYVTIRNPPLTIWNHIPHGLIQAINLTYWMDLPWNIFAADHRLSFPIIPLTISIFLSLYVYSSSCGSCRRRQQLLRSRITTIMSFYSSSFRTKQREQKREAKGRPKPAKAHTANTRMTENDPKVARINDCVIVASAKPGSSSVFG